jgi:peptide/nickel transport system permease protein
MAGASEVSGASSILRERLENDIDRFRKFLIQVLKNRLAFAGLTIILVFTVLSFSAPLLVGPYPSPLNSSQPNLPPSNAHPMGTDWNGYDVLSLVVYGGQISLIIGFSASVVAMVLGTTVGLVAGYYGGVTDQTLARVTDFFLVIPWLPFVLVLVMIMGSTLLTIILAIAIVSWPTTARVIRSQVLTIKERQFIERSRAVGAKSGYIVRKHILPNVMPLVWAEAVLTVSNSVFTEAFLSFFGLGVQGPNVIKSWGTLVNESYVKLALLKGQWWYFGPPGLFITVVVLGFAMLGYGLEDILNPALKRRG